MRILVISQYFWPENFRINDLVQGLVQKGDEVVVLTGFPNYPLGKRYPAYKQFQFFKTESYQGAKIVRVCLYSDHSLSIFRRLLNYTSFAFTASLFGPFLCGLKFDRIFVFQPGPFSVGVPAILFKILTRAPAFIWVQDIWPDGLRDSGAVKQGWILNAVQFLAKFIYKQFEKVMITSPGFEERLSEMGISKRRIDYLPQWSEDFYQIVERDEELLHQEKMHGKFNILFAGNLGLGQDLENIIEAANLLRNQPDIQFVFIGSGLSLPDLIASVEKRGLTNVSFKEKKSPELMPQYFALADALLVQLKRTPSYAMTIPGKLQTYLASGKPIIAALEGSGAEVVKQANAGIVCEPSNPESLKDAVLTLYKESAEARLAMGLRGRSYFESHFSRSIVLRKLGLLLDEK